MKTDYDVIIVGAGPAGASCAKHLTENGIKSLVIEKRKLPRYKACGGLLSKRAEGFIIENYGKIPQKIICENSRLNIAVSKTGKFFTEVPNTEMLKTFRKDLDYWLISNSNTKIFSNCIYKSHIEKNNYIEVYLIKDETKIILTCRYLIGADGGNSLVRKNIDLNFKKEYLIYAHQEIYKANIEIEKNLCYYIMGKKFTPFIAWFFYENDYIFIGNTYYPKEINYFNILIEFLKSEYNLIIYEIIRKEGCYTNIKNKESNFFFGNGNILICGEACGFLTSFAEGISPALISGKIVAETIIKNFNKKKIIQNYIEEIQEEKKNIIDSWEKGLKTN